MNRIALTIAALTLCAPAFAAPGQYPGGAGFTSSSYRAGSYTVTVIKGKVSPPPSSRDLRGSKAFINYGYNVSASQWDGVSPSACCNPN